MNTPVRVLIIGTGGMAESHVKAYAAMDQAVVVAGVDNDSDKLKHFCDDHQIKNRFSCVEDALTWGQFDAASNVTPDGVHYQTSLPLIEAGKHLLCEKPLAVKHADAQEMANRAKASNIVNGINLSYRDVPALQYASKLVTEGAIGEVRHFEASYLQSWLCQSTWGDWKTEPQWLWRLSSKHGSNGVLGDIGIHILDFATFVAGSLPVQVSSRLQTFDKAPGNAIGEYVLDANDSFVMHAQLSNGAIGTVSATRFATGHMNDLRLRIYGDKGGLEVLFENQTSRLNACLAENIESASWSEIPCPDVQSNYQRFISAIQEGKSMNPDFARGAQLQKLLDQMLEA